MKILVVGSFIWEIYEKPLLKAFQELGFDTYKFEWKNYFDYSSSFSFNWKNLLEYPSKFCEVFKRAQNKYHIGPTVNKMNRDLISYAKEIRPDLIFIYYGIFSNAKTIRALKDGGAKVFGYCNDDPFSSTPDKFYWKVYLSSCPEYDHVFSYRIKNIEDYKRTYGIESELLRSYYIEDRNFRLNIQDDRYKCDVLFIGHYEDDGRDEFLEKLINAGCSFKLYGSEWHRSKYYDDFRKLMGGDIQQLREDYNIAINSCKIALVFLSSNNNDTYTRRCFEIPAAGTFMLSEYTEDMASLFEPDKEAVYFRTPIDLINKIEYYLAHDDEREKIAQNGYERLRRDGHEIKDRARQIIRAYEKITGEN